mgnify:CR=1 FL=1
MSAATHRDETMNQFLLVLFWQGKAGPQSGSADPDTTPFRPNFVHIFQGFGYICSLEGIASHTDKLQHEDTYIEAPTAYWSWNSQESLQLRRSKIYYYCTLAVK